MTMPTGRPTDDDFLEARLRAAFERDVIRAATDIGTGSATISPTGTDRWRQRRAPALGVALAAFAAFAVVVGLLSQQPHRTAVIGSSPSPVGSETPAPSATWLGPIFPVGAGAEEHIATARDATDFLVSGWIVGAPDTTCQRRTATWSACDALRLHPAAGGGPGLALYRQYGVTTPAPAIYWATKVTARVRTHDPACQDASCAQLPVLLGFVDVEPAVALAEQRPWPQSAAIEQRQAEEAAAKAAFGGAYSPDLAIVSSTLAPAGISSPLWPEVDAARRVWTVTLARTGDASGDETVVAVDGETGSALGSWSAHAQAAPIPSPMASIPRVLGLVPVHQGDDARTAVGQTTGPPLLVGGWLQGLDRRVCPTDGTGVRSGTWNPCTGLWLHDSPAGGSPLALLADPTAAIPASSTPADGEAIPVVVRVIGVGWTSAGGTTEMLPMANEVVWSGTPVKSLDIGTAPSGVSQVAAEQAAQAYVFGKQPSTLRVAVRITLAAYTAIAGGQFSMPGVSQDSWVWLLLYTDDSHSPNSAQAVMVTLAEGRPVGGTSTFP